tara:strand:+ start:169 stop:1575 length:1407 start_codon:yes stop_codon:yes gene_type:complete
MFKQSKTKILIFVISTIIIIGGLLISITIGFGNLSNIKTLLNPEQRQLIKKYIFPYKLISQQEQIISKQQQVINQEEKKIRSFVTNLELSDKQSNISIKTFKKTKELSDGKILNKYKLASGFYAGINKTFPGTGYIDFHLDNVIVLSSRGVLSFKKNIEDTEENFQQIKNNINEFIGINQFIKNRNFSLKDLFVFNNKIFISLTEEIQEDCWNTSIIYGDINYENIKFEKLFTAKDCIHSIDNIDKEFRGQQSGGRMVSFDDKNILLTIGEYRSRPLAQDIKSINGKIIKVNIDNSDYEIIAMGLRNSQGLYFDKEKNFILATDHGPQGGDEINLIEVSKINKDKIQNYGWPISSYGEFYGGRIEKNKKLYEKYSLYKSHSEHGFIEPLKSFVPSIAISEIVKIEQNKYVLSSLKDRSIYFFELNEQKQIINFNRVEVFERVRDLRFNDNKLYLFMEDTASIGVINLS